MINWKSKLTSRKFWVAIIAFITSILVAFNVDNSTIQNITGIITSGAVAIAYIIGEGMIDVERAKKDDYL